MDGMAMNAPNPPPYLAISGAAMDEQVPQRRGRKVLLAIGLGVLAMAAAAGAWNMIPRGMQVAAADVRTAAVEQGVFYDDVVARAKAESLHSVILDSVESGRVEEVFASDGVIVKQGDVLFRLSNAQRQLELLQRQSEHAQQISNLANLRVNFETGNTDHVRRLAELQYTEEQLKKKHERNLQLAKQGFLSPAAIMESADSVAQQERLIRDENERGSAEASVKRAAVEQMESATHTIERGLSLVNAAVDALTVRAPVSGRLTEFKLQVGEAVHNDKYLGRIDDPSHFKLTANIDEYYLNRIALGRPGVVRQDGRDYAIEVSRVLPQITDGRFTVEMVFKGEQPAALNPGRTLDAQITLGEPKPALVLPNAPYLSETGGAWVFVMAPNGVDAEKRPIKIGRRNNRQVEVLNGLKPGEKVIISSYAAFSNAAQIQLRKM